MMKVLTAAEMRTADKTATEEFGIPSIVLMENAALSVVGALEEECAPLRDKRVAVFCGGGNNGGDGFAVARHLFNRNAAVRVFLFSDPETLKGDALENYRILEKMGVETQTIEADNQLSVLRLALVSCDIVVDALLGTGISGMVSELYKGAIDIINNCRSKVFSVDIPSGLDADDGSIHGSAVRADVTVTMAYPKLGMVLPAAAPYIGRLIVGDISMPQEVMLHMNVRRELLTADFCRRFLPRRQRVSHKGDYGTLLLMAGSRDMPGAAALAAKGALYGGVGRVQAALPQECRGAFCAGVKEATLISLAEDNAQEFAPSAAQALKDREYSALVLGMGIGRAPQTQTAVREILFAADKPCVVDADALYALCGEKELVRSLRQPLIFTPHEGEFARLCGKSVAEIRADAIKTALDFAAEWNVILVLKRACTLIATPEGRLFINNTGNPGMATAGSGDVLSGLIAALAAQRLAPAAAAAVAVYLHGLAGDIAAAEKGEYALTATDIAENIHNAFKEIYKEDGK